MGALMFYCCLRSLRLLICMSLLLGLIYPAIVWSVGQIFFQKAARGSLIIQNDKIIGSELIGQEFKSPRYFWGRPSATDYGTLPGAASNSAPTSLKLKERIDKRMKELKDVHPGLNPGDIPADLLLASGSGLDPHISPEAALFQADRVIKERRFSKKQAWDLKNEIQNLREGRRWGIFGEPRVNVLKLNLKVDEISAMNY